MRGGPSDAVLFGESRAMDPRSCLVARLGKTSSRSTFFPQGMKLPGATNAGAVWRTQEVMCVNCRVLPHPFLFVLLVSADMDTVREAPVSRKSHLGPGLTGRPPAWLPVVLSALCSSWPTFLHGGLVFRVASKRQFHNL